MATTNTAACGCAGYKPGSGCQEGLRLTLQMEIDYATWALEGSHPSQERFEATRDAWYLHIGTEDPDGND